MAGVIPFKNNKIFKHEVTVLEDFSVPLGRLDLKWM